MSLLTIDARLIMKRSTTASEVPTIPTGINHEDPTWLDTDLYSGEFFINENDQKIWIRMGASLFQFRMNADGADGIDAVLAVGEALTAARVISCSNNNLTLEGVGLFTVSGTTTDLQTAVEQKRLTQSASTSLTVDLEDANIYHITVDAAGDFDYSNVPPSSKSASYIFKFTQDSTGYAVGFATGKFQGANGLTPTISSGANEVTILSGYWDGSKMIITSLNDIQDI